MPHTTTDVTNWFTAGYTTEKLIDAGQQILDTTMAAFPTQYVALAIAGNGHAETNRNLDLTATYAAATTISMTRAKWPGRLVPQINSLSTFNPVAPGPADSVWRLLFDSEPDVAAQMLDNVYGDSSYRG